MSQPGVECSRTSVTGYDELTFHRDAFEVVVQIGVEVYAL